MANDVGVGVKETRKQGERDRAESEYEGKAAADYKGYSKKLRKAVRRKDYEGYARQTKGMVDDGYKSSSDRLKSYSKSEMAHKKESGVLKKRADSAAPLHNKILGSKPKRRKASRKRSSRKSE
jgi:hypothetical protein